MNPMKAVRDRAMPIAKVKIISIDDFFLLNESRFTKFLPIINMNQTKLFFCIRLEIQNE